jgi:hypothetical protein
MRRFDFRADTLTEEDERHWQRQSRQPRSFNGALGNAAGWVLLGLAAFYVYHSYLNYHSRFGKLTAVINGKTFTAGEVLLLVDASGSMRGTDAMLGRQTDQLRQARVNVSNRYNTDGFGFSVSGPDNNALHGLEQALHNYPAADAIYLFSDFDPTTNPYAPDANDPAGYGRLRDLLRQGHRRLYLGTVRSRPPEPLIRIARESGGDLISSR